MKVTRIALLALALGGGLLLGSDARAASISYLAVGEFIGGTGNNLSPTGDTFTSSTGVVIQYQSNTTTDYDLNFGETTTADFGSFVVLASPGGTISTPVSADFELSIFQVDPTPGGSIIFKGALAGSLRLGQSGAYVQFEGPLTQSIGDVTYRIVEADNGVAGRTVLVPATLAPDNVTIIPGVTDIQAEITLVPEPATLAMLGMGVLAPIGMMLRRRVRATA